MQVNVEDVAELKKFLPIEESFSPSYGRLVCLQVRTTYKERKAVRNTQLIQHFVYGNNMSPQGHVRILPATRPASLGGWGNRCLLSLNGQCFENSLVLCAVL
jgi:hypothetical protein